MPLNLAEAQFFQSLALQMEKTPPKPFSQQTIEELREGGKLFTSYCGQPADVSYVEKEIEARDGYKVPIRIYNQDSGDNVPVLIFYPGSLYMFKTFEANAICCSRIAQELPDAKVIVVNHRLVPEHPLFVPIQDCYDVTRAIAGNAQNFGIDPKRLILCGYSSGAHCAHLIANWVAKSREFSIHHQILLNGLYDLNLTDKGYSDYEKEDKLFTREAAAALIKRFFDLKEQEYSPLYAENVDLPRTTILCGEYDYVRGESEELYKVLKRSGAHVEKIVLEGQTHCTFNMREVLSDGLDPAKVIADAASLLREGHPMSTPSSLKA